MAFDYKHGGIIKEKARGPAVGSRAIDVAQPFDYLFPKLARDADALLPSDDPSATIERLKELGAAMVDDDAPADDSSMPPVYTYLGQFIDHDITVTMFDDATTGDITAPFVPLDAETARGGVSNGRRAILDLDSLYGDGPTFDGESPETEAHKQEFFVGPKMRLGMITTLEDIDGDAQIPGEFIPPIGDLKRDLPRNGNGVDPEASEREPLIGDRRNDENTIVAQLHTAFLRFHNALVDAIDSGDQTPPEPPHGKGPTATKGYYDSAPSGEPGGCGSPPRGDRALFEQAATLARRHYQWIVLHDFTKRIGKASVVERVIEEGPRFYRPEGPFPFMPFEHSVSAFRFGHSMVRHEYDFNRNFSPDGLVARATFDQLFRFTGKGGFSPAPSIPGTSTLPFNWVIEWDRMVETGGARGQAARKIDTRLASDLANMFNEVEPDSDQPPDVQELLRHLAQRNLLRGYLLAVPSGQAMAETLGFEPLTADELRSGNGAAMNRALESGGFLERTPSWYYILKEAEVREDGESLGEVGTAIVAETFVGLLKADPRSILNEAAGWTPDEGVGVSTIAELLSFAGVLPESERGGARRAEAPA